MIIGKLATWMQILSKGQAVVVDYEVIKDSAKYYLESSFDIVRDSDIQTIVDEVNSREYPEYSITKRIEDGLWTLHRFNPNQQ